VPREVHEHQSVVGHNPDGTAKVETTGYTVVTRESVWDAATLERVMRVVDYRESLCPCGCGIPVDQAWDPYYEPWSVDSFTCYARRALESVARRWQKQNEGQPDGWADGVEHFVTAPDEASHNDEAQRKAEERDRMRRGQGGD
jgi:hypothetical protein